MEHVEGCDKTRQARLPLDAADFSGAGLGKYVSFMDNYYLLGGITLSKHKEATASFVNSMKSAGIWDKFDVIHLRGFGTALADSINIKNPSSLTTKSVFYNDISGAHTSAGYIPNTSASRNARTLSPLPATINNLHLHSYNSVVETATESVFLGCNVSGSTIYLSRKISGVTKSNINSSTISVSGLTTRTSLLSSAIVGLEHKLYDTGSIVGSGTLSAAPTNTGSNAMLWESTFEGGGSTLTSNANNMFSAWGTVAWSNADEIQLNAIVEKFVSDMFAS